ncbi:MAG: hypothetical protein LBT42_03780 [Tannerella sp.]|nr:hypothetical protein [Tannerella sp.]
MVDKNLKVKVDLSIYKPEVITSTVCKFTDRYCVAQRKDRYRRAIFIHLDSRSIKRRMDVYFYYQNNIAAGQGLANTMRDKYRKHQPDRGFTGTVTTRKR